MEAIAEPTRAYSSPPAGRLPDKCPNCRASLGQFLQLPVAELPIPSPASLLQPIMPTVDELRGIVAIKPPTPVVSTALPADPSDELWQHPRLGGGLTVFALLYGDDTPLHRRCLDSLIASKYFRNLDLRVICSDAGPATFQLLDHLSLKPAYAFRETHKYQAMARAFSGEERPLATKWLVWLDDVAWCKRTDWIENLAKVIVAQDEDEHVGAIGCKLCHELRSIDGHDPRTWFRAASWFRGRNFRNRQGQEAANGDCIHYLSPNFFAISRQAVDICGIPDRRLIQSGGGIVIGEQLHQNGFKLKAFNSDREFVRDEQTQRIRGLRETYPWQQ